MFLVALGAVSVLTSLVFDECGDDTDMSRALQTKVSSDRALRHAGVGVVNPAPVVKR